MSATLAAAEVQLRRPAPVPGCVCVIIYGLDRIFFCGLLSTSTHIYIHVYVRGSFEELVSRSLYEASHFVGSKIGAPCF